MSLKSLIGLNNSTITDEEISKKIEEAMKRNIENIEIFDQEGHTIRIHVPSLSFDKDLMNNTGSW
jgi:hypothetical protein